MTGNTARLTQISLSLGGTRVYTFGPAGHLEEVNAAGNVIDLTSDDASRLASLERSQENANFSYDGRSFLATATEVGSNFVTPTYSSQGLLYSLSGSHDGGTTTSNRHVFYFAGRPIATFNTAAAQYTFLSTDHLGTPVVATDGNGDELWGGGFEPFGTDWQRGTPQDAQANGIFLRFPGQWFDETWEDASSGLEGFYNVHRWYEHGTGRYSRTDPLGLAGDSHPYLYAYANPLVFIDPLGEKSRVCCTPVPLAPGPAKHCFIEREDDTTGKSTTYALHRVKGKGCTYKDDNFDRSRHPDRDPRTDCGPWSPDCDDGRCLEREFQAYPNPSDYQLIRGPNSNSFTRTLTEACGLTPPAIAGEPGQTPGWSKEGRPAKNRKFKCPPKR